MRSYDVGVGFEAIEQHFTAGRYFTAYQLGRSHGLFEQRSTASPDHALLAARVLRGVGAPRRGRKLLLETWRRHRSHPRVKAFVAYERIAAGPLLALEWMDHVGDVVDGTAEDRSDWLSARALCASELRDFAAADQAMRAAHDLHVDAWTWCVQATIEKARDRVDEALAAIAHARELSPWYRPALDLGAMLLVRARRRDEARALLVEAGTHLESPSTEVFLGGIQREANDLDAAIASLRRAVMWSPAMERDLHDLLAWQLGLTHYLRGDVELGVRLIQLSSSEHARRLAERIATTTGARRRVPVPHVPQHHNTCAPATLTAICELWGERADHTEIAEHICYDGTPAGSERRWAEKRGFVARQFTVTWEAAVALIDAGIPFALTTSFTIGAHLQPVAGYDPRSGSLLVPDPSAPWSVELDWGQLVEAQAPFGPRGMVFVPAPRASALDGIALPDSALYDHHYEIEMALQRHDRAAARAAYDALAAAAPANHYLLHQARRALAGYDGDERETLAWVGELRTTYPNHAWLRMCELAALHGHAEQDHRAALANGLLADHPRDPGILVTCGRFLLGSGAIVRARQTAERAISIAPQHGAAYQLAADATWALGQRSRALRLLRVASCLADRDEQAAWSYFAAATITAQVDDALAYLRARVSRLGARSAAPARTLCEACTAIGRISDGMEILEAALEDHPDDGELLIAAAEQYRVGGDVTRATALLERARGNVPDAMWRRAAAGLAVPRGNVEEALALRRQLVADDPLDIQSQYAYVALLERAGQTEAVRLHVDAACDRFPFHIPLAKLHAEVLAVRDPAAAEQRLSGFVDRQPTSGWALLRLAELEMRRGQLSGARELLARARTCSEDPAAVEVAEARLAAREARHAEAIEHLTTAIRLDIDSPGAVPLLLELVRDGVDARTTLDLIGAELSRQGSSGPGLAEFATGIRLWLDPLTALARLHSLRVERAHQWSPWSAEIDALMGAGRNAAAAQLAVEATQRFGNDPRAWRQLALVEGTRGDRAAQLAALERARELEPHSTELMRRVADAHLASGDPARARKVLERAIAEEPLGENNHGYLALAAHDEGERETARRHILRAVELQPEYAWAWAKLLEWSEDSAPVFAEMRAAVERTPSCIVPRSLLAQFAPDLAVEERRKLLDEAIGLAPDRADLYDVKAELLAQHEMWDDALAACRPTFWGETPPVNLDGRAAWVRFQRGDRAAAIDQMIAVVRRTPSYDWGIQQLLEWGKAIGEPIATAERLTEAAPDSAFAHAVLGELSREAGDHANAESSFARALEIDGTQRLARLGLFDARFEQAKYESAEPLLAELDTDDPYVMARRVQICAARERLDAADAEVARMLRRGVADPTVIEEVITGYRSARAGDRLASLLDRLLAEHDAHEAVAVAWWKVVGRHLGRFRRWRQLRRLPPSEATEFARVLHIEDYAERPGALGLLVFITLNFRILRATTAYWGSAGYALLRTWHASLASWWMRDHAGRSGVKPWMLKNLWVAYLLRQKAERAITVSRRAIALPPDHSTHSSMLLVASTDAITDVDASTRALSAARRAPWLDLDRFLGDLTEAVIAYSQSGRDAASRDALCEHLEVVWRRHRHTKVAPLARRAYRHVISELARTVRPIWKRWWWWLHLWRIH